jgi:hypothetical protein
MKTMANTFNKVECSRQEVTAKAQYAALLGAQVVITGLWAWASFPEAPSKETREKLKAEGFRWAKNKGKWYFAGKPASNRRTMSWMYITSKYGAEELAA